MKNNIDHIFTILSKANPEPKTELKYINDFTLLVAIILSAQSTDVGVNKATAELFKVVGTPQDLKNLGLEALKKYIKTIGLYNNKAKNLIALSEILISKPIPTTIQELEKLPGVGSKTARVFLNCAKKIPVIAVDTHVFRVSKRLGIAFGKNPKSVEIELNNIIPDKWKLHAHHWLILHGRYICKARKPDCLNCSIAKLCKFLES
ncbi:MAG: endonuclease III [Pseudomonadota bacterium]